MKSGLGGRLTVQSLCLALSQPCTKTILTPYLLKPLSCCNLPFPSQIVYSLHDKLQLQARCIFSISSDKTQSFETSRMHFLCFLRVLKLVQPKKYGLKNCKTRSSSISI
jgi:hypothetical protein